MVGAQAFPREGIKSLLLAIGRGGRDGARAGAEAVRLFGLGPEAEFYVVYHMAVADAAEAVMRPCGKGGRARRRLFERGAAAVVERTGATLEAWGYREAAAIHRASPDAAATLAFRGERRIVEALG